MDAIENITLFMEHRRKYGTMRKASSQVLVATATVVIPIILFGSLFLVFASNQVSAEILEVYTKIFNSVGSLGIILLIMALIRYFGGKGRRRVSEGKYGRNPHVQRGQLLLPV